MAINKQNANIRAPLRLAGAGTIPAPAGCDAGAATAVGPEDADDELDEAGSEPRFGFGTGAEGPAPTATAEPVTPTGAGLPTVAGGPAGTGTEVDTVTGELAGTPPGLLGVGAAAGGATVMACGVGAV